MTEKIEQTLVLIKPDAVERKLIGEIIARCEAKGYLVREIKRVAAPLELLEAHYAEHHGKVFYQPLIDFMRSGDTVAIRLEGHRVIEGFRAIAGTTDPTLAAAGTIRGDLGRDWGEKVQRNLVHGSDSLESAERELALWFS
jgi:nucleoside-diphosphate kinase